MGIFINLTNFLANWELTIGERFCLWVDKVIYSGVDAMYNVFNAIATINPSQIEGIDYVKDRLFILIGIFMIFRLTVSLLNYLVYPDKLSDSQNGLGATNLIKSIFISLALLSVVNLGFEKIYEFQDIILEEKVIDKLILGNDLNSNLITAEGYGSRLSTTIFSSFIVYKGENGGTFCADPNSESCVRYQTLLHNAIIGDDTTIDDFYGIVEDPDVIYNKFYSGLAGLFVIIMLLTFTVDVGVRIFKLLFYQIIAPIPIIMYMEPTKKEMLSKWFKGVIGTFVDLFIRIAMVFLSIVLISNLPNLLSVTLGSTNHLSGFSQGLAYFLMIVAILIFAKKVPALAKELLGINSDDLSINPFKKTGLGAAVGSFAGAALGSTFGFGKSLAKGEGVKKAVGAGVNGAYSGAVSGSHATNIKDVLARSRKAAGVGAAGGLAGGIAGGFNRIMSNTPNATGTDRTINRVEGAENRAQTIATMRNSAANLSSANKKMFARSKGEDRAQHIYNGINDRKNNYNSNKQKLDEINEKLRQADPSNVMEYNNLKSNQESLQNEISNYNSVSDSQYKDILEKEWDKEEKQYFEDMLKINYENESGDLSYIRDDLSDAEIAKLDNIINSSSKDDVCEFIKLREKLESDANNMEYTPGDIDDLGDIDKILIRSMNEANQLNNNQNGSNSRR